MTLQRDSIDWAIDFIVSHSDGDLFPKMPEIEALVAKKLDFISLIEGKSLESLPPGVCRRFLVSKDEVSYRQATQLDLQDSIILSAIIHQFGSGIEARRLPNNVVFSYRFFPTAKNGLYGDSSAWNNFWKHASILSKGFSNILYCDIADFYNQIYHHIVENQLGESGFPNQVIKWVRTLLETTTAGVSRGIPIGPHAAHLIAEATLIPIDNSLLSCGVRFIRYVDDIVVFCNSESEARSAIFRIASILDKQQRLLLQRHKTKFFQPDEFRTLCDEMIEDRPINSNEMDILAIIRKNTNGNPYKTITYDQIPKEDWQSISEATIQEIIEEYITQPQIDFFRLRWFYRRLSQIGHPGAINVSLDNLDKLGACFANICSYLASVQSVDPSDWNNIGNKLLQLLELSEVKENEYNRLSILSLFSRNIHLNHFSTLAKLYQSSDPFVRREILLAAKANSAFDWAREYKESFQVMDPWQKIAFLYCISGLPTDEKKFFINSLNLSRPFEVVLARWSKGV